MLYIKGLVHNPLDDILNLLTEPRDGGEKLGLAYRQGIPSFEGGLSRNAHLGDFQGALIDERYRFVIDEDECDL